MIRSLNRAPRPAVPTEVVERIIDMVAEKGDLFYPLEERPVTLHACTLVARSWVPRSRIHLYRDVMLWSDRRTRRFLNSLALYPDLGQYVETLRVEPKNKDEKTCGWIFKAISTLPPLLPHLRQLAFFNLPDLRSECIVVLSRFRTVESLMLYRLEKQSLREVIQLISRFPHLRRLRVQFCEWELPGRCYSGKQHNLTTLHVDSFSDCGRLFLEWALASKSTHALTSFHTRSGVAGSAIHRVLETCCSTLRQLDLRLFDDFQMPLLTNHLNLQRLALQGLRGKVIRVLGRLPLFAPSSLISIRTIFWDSGIKPLEKNSESEWKAIDLALCNPKFPHLKSVEFTGPSSKPPQNPHAFFQQSLPTCYKRGMLWYRPGFKDTYMRIAPVDAPQYPGLPLEWEEL